MGPGQGNTAALQVLFFPTIGVIKWLHASYMLVLHGLWQQQYLLRCCNPIYLQADKSYRRLTALPAGPTCKYFLFHTGGLTALIPQASELQRQQQAGLGRPALGWYQQPKQAQQAVPAKWVAEADLPLWLVRGHEERARREAALAAAEAERLAARVSTRPSQS